MVITIFYIYIIILIKSYRYTIPIEEFGAW